MNIAENVFEKVSKIGDEAIVLVTRSISHQIRFSENKIDVAKTWREVEISAIVDKDKKSAVISLTYPGLKRIDQVLESLKISLEKATPRPIYAPPPEPSSSYPSIGDKVDETIRDNPEKLIDVVKVSIDSALSEGAKKVAGSMRGRYFEIALLSTRGAELKDSYTNTYIDFRAMMSGVETGHASQIERRLADIDAEGIGVRAAQRAKLSRNPKKLEPGRYDTVITENATASIINLVGRSLSAFSVLMGFSFLANKLGQEIGSEKFTLVDTTVSKNSSNPRSFDDEGVATRENILFDKGVLRSYLHNRFTAKAFNVDLTGNAGWISPHPWHLILKEGDLGEDELIESLGEGLIVNSITYIRFQNYVKGDFSGILRDGVYYVKNGEIRHAVKGLRFSDNAPRILKNIVGVGKRSYNVHHWWLEANISVTTPSILVKKCGYTKAYGE